MGRKGAEENQEYRRKMGLGTVISEILKLPEGGEFYREKEGIKGVVQSQL